jgi:hypothetical protein
MCTRLAHHDFTRRRMSRFCDFTLAFFLEPSHSLLFAAKRASFIIKTCTLVTKDGFFDQTVLPWRLGIHGWNAPRARPLLSSNYRILLATSKQSVAIFKITCQCKDIPASQNFCYCWNCPLFAVSPWPHQQLAWILIMCCGGEVHSAFTTAFRSTWSSRVFSRSSIESFF